MKEKITYTQRRQRGSGSSQTEVCSHFQYKDVLLEQRDHCSNVHVWGVLREVQRLAAAGCAWP